ncbi:hypothetical protein EZ428_20255 [Pedobacter frigiditerrae]|uniref:Uncharacterized protein n=1 Tax=Pedobacter frigiditerrae TaxID=2530452 RepID=A0A4R0MMU4_9SPHI|nr:hypothetical protein [Pedobacter frigiditerrae]TCC88058.1 hypothetical protein EZ428_20255 [Pedobacter frigiditerrae]
MKATKPSDHFDLKHCLKGLGLFMIMSYTQAYYFCFYLTFKKSLKSLANEFKDAEDHQITDYDFFKDIDDPLVRHAHSLFSLLSTYFRVYELRNGLNDVELVEWDDTVESNRYSPSLFYFGRKTSYVKIAFAYERYVEELENSFYYYCCALSLKSYQIPLNMRTRLDYSATGSFRYLNVEDYEVNSMIELIGQLQEQHKLLKELMRK